MSLLAMRSFANSENSKPLVVQPAEKSEIETSIPIEKIDSGKDLPARVLFLKLKKVEDAENYEVQIRPLNQSWVDPYTIRTTREKIRIRMSPGQYELRTRSLDGKKRRGHWLAWKRLLIPMKTLTAVNPADQSEVQAKGEIKEKLTFEWPQVKGAKAYRFKLYNGDRKLMKHVINKQSWISVELDVDRGFFWSVAPLTSVDEPENPLFEKLVQFRISKPDSELTKVQMKLSENPRAIKYQFELVRMISDDESSEPTVYESREPDFNARLSPGQFELRVRTLYDNATVSAWGRPLPIQIPIPNPPPISPEHGFVLDPTDDISNPIHLEWTKSKWASKYQVFVFDENGTVVVNEMTEKTELDVNLAHKQHYRWYVKALLPREGKREPANMTEEKNKDIAEQFEIGEYIKLNLGQSEEPSQLYAWSGVIMSNVSYVAENFDNANRVQQKYLASTGELALGYWHRKTSYGGLLLGRMSGMKVGGKAVIFGQYSALFGIRKSLDESKRLRFWGGPSLKETPEVQVTGVNGEVEVAKLGTLGANFLTTYMDAFNDTWGYQAYAGVFYGLKGTKTPNDLEQNKFFSYFGSAYLTYKWNRMATLMGGYTYQVDEAGYKSADRTGNDNHIKYTGHYLSLSVIFGLQDPEK